MARRRGWCFRGGLGGGGLRPQCSLWHRYFSVNIAKFLRIPILENICKWLLLTGVNFICVVSRAILKSVYRFGIPNSNPQMLKSVDFWCKLLSTFHVAESREQCFELFRMQNSQKFPGFCPWTPLGRDYSTTSDSLALQWFFSSLHSSKNRHPQKIAGYSTVYNLL